ncbi:MAG: hypothetical protein UX92_C0008G0008 [Candidatus Amesbacteria bacterium GW2011_GWA1_47_20]|uniref:Glycosyltransferase RgtA/B/C/D-like domain-containing protein n=2 Tax=Candidatus Amesiibacteriota TaxID=1752730 RepID=A0A0G1VIF8_9BACT|nr:MAG: hypothetical protein UX42_C0026G0009 [Microgenomates group bacterium GW2011_GWC1_46_20]KKU69840.1 MAG: hypothetical protein UX92_C0008G0008 [Candidatus Amesbacteria bacterium GW2011_GWA1_47_20]
MLLLAALLRLISLGTLPNGLHWDEMDTGYQAYSLLRTGKDYFNNPLPMFPHSFADFRTPVFIYSAVPFVAFLGLSATSVRLIAVTWGLVSIVLIYLLVRDWLAPLVFALSPWHLQYSRKSVETMSLTATFLLGLVCFQRGLRQPRWLILSALGFGLAMSAYAPGKLFVPLFLLVLVFIYRRSVSLIPQKSLIAPIVILLLFAVTVYGDTLFGKSGTRFHDVAIFTDPTIATEINYQRQLSAEAGGRARTVGMSPGIVDKLLHNKPQVWINTFLTNYLRTWSTDFLFIKGDLEPRHSPSRDSIGMLHMLEIVPFLIGIYLITRKKNWLLASWLLLAPIPSALTRDGGVHAARLLILFPALAWTITLGIRRLPVKLYLLLFLISNFYVWGYYFTHYRFESAKPFQWGFSQMITTAVSRQNDYDRVIVDFNRDSPLMAYLFTTKFPPARLQAMHPLQEQILTGDARALVFGKIWLMQPGGRNWTNISLSGRNLVIASADQSLLDRIPGSTRLNYPDSLPAFYTFEKSSP